jgi:hypothetical protein
MHRQLCWIGRPVDERAAALRAAKLLDAIPIRAAQLV